MVTGAFAVAEAQAEEQPADEEPPAGDTPAEPATETQTNEN